MPSTGMLSPRRCSRAYYEDIRAVLKRCNVVVFSVENVYIRVACHTAAQARGLGYGGGGLKDLLLPSCKDMFAKYKA
eukprot:5349781-Amphidinium_carterae.1